MVCTFGDLTDVTWWRDLNLPARVVLGRDGRLLDLAGPELAGLTVAAARRRMVDLLSTVDALAGDPVPVRHAVKFYEKGDRPLEIITTRQWYIRNGGRDDALRSALVARGSELAWHPPYMRHRYDNWVKGLQWDWLISRQRFFGVAFPIWYCKKCGGEILAHDLIEGFHVRIGDAGEA